MKTNVKYWNHQWKSKLQDILINNRHGRVLIFCDVYGNHSFKKQKSTLYFDSFYRLLILFTTVRQVLHEKTLKEEDLGQKTWSK